MEQNFDYKTVPFDYLHCQNAKCPHTADCLHYQVALHISKDTRFYPLINPAYVAGKEKKCPYFQKDELTHFAKGIKKLYDNVPHAKAMEIRRILYAHFDHNITV